MANVFAILSAIALAAACFLAVKNKEKYASEIELRQQEEKTRDKNNKDLTAMTADYETNLGERKKTEDEVTALKEQEAGQKKIKTDLDSKVASKTAESEKNATQITKIEEDLKEVGPIDELVATITKLKSDLEGLKLDIAAGDAKLANLQSDKARTQGVIAKHLKKNDDISHKRSFFEATRISAIYPVYGFVTLPIGNTSGVVSGSPLNVMRDGSVIAKLRVKSVEAGRAAAEIVPDSVAADTTLMVGDRVVPGSEEAAAAPAPRQ